MVVWGISCASICPEFGSFARLARAHAVQNRTAMITVGVIRNGGTYLSQHLRKNDYWAEGEQQVRGEWFGQAAARLGLEGTVTDAPFEALVRESRGKKLSEVTTAEVRALESKSARSSLPRKCFQDLRRGFLIDTHSGYPQPANLVKNDETMVNMKTSLPSYGTSRNTAQNVKGPGKSKTFTFYYQ